MQNLSIDLLKKKLKRYPYLNELEFFLNRIEKENLKLILLYGSLAKGRYTQNSDIDVLCVFDKKFHDLKERFMISYKYSDGRVQPKTITFKELELGLKEGNSFLLSIFDHGIVLYNSIPRGDLEKWLKMGRENLNLEYFPPT